MTKFESSACKHLAWQNVSHPDATFTNLTATPDLKNKQQNVESVEKYKATGRIKRNTELNFKQCNHDYFLQNREISISN